MAYTRLKVLELENFPNNSKCSFCQQNISDELKYGKIYKCGDIITHYFCMLFSSQMEQNGRDEDGILGFLPADIKKEISRGSKVECIYCHREGATISCTAKTCKRRFHFPCGIINESLHQFFGQFRSFCVVHRRPQIVPPQWCSSSEIMICVMCQEEVKRAPSMTTVWAPCCKNAWFHRDCVQKMAVSAGYFFKCPNCNNKEEFRNEMREAGIYIPDQDASWELEPNAFQELNERHSSCDAEICDCPRGREYSHREGLWEIILCSNCGSSGIHTKCGRITIESRGQWFCPLCALVELRIPSNANENPGPSELPAIRARSGSSRPAPSVVRRRGPGRRRRRNISPSPANNSDAAPPKKTPRLTAPEASAETNKSETTTTLLGKAGEQIQVVRLDSMEQTTEQVVEIGGVNINPDDNIVSLDTEDEDSDSDESENTVMNGGVENHDSRGPATFAESNKSASERDRENRVPAVVANSTADVIIDLLDDSDEEVEPANQAAQTTRHTQSSTSLHLPNSISKDEDGDDDVIFVGSTVPEQNKVEGGATSALIRIVQNDTVYVVSPSEIKKRVNSETVTSLINHATTNNFITSTSIGRNTNTVWQSVPRDKSIVHSVAQSQVVSSSLDNNFNHINSVNNRSLVASPNQQKLPPYKISELSDKMASASRNIPLREYLSTWTADSTEIINID